MQATLHSLVGLGLIYLASSWLLIYFASAFTSTKRDLKDFRRLAKSSSAGEGLYTNSGSSMADAAIDIRAGDSPLASYKAGSAAAPRTGRHDDPFFVHNMAADARGERDTGPRLPYV